MISTHAAPDKGRFLLIWPTGSRLTATGVVTRGGVVTFGDTVVLGGGEVSRDLPVIADVVLPTGCDAGGLWLVTELMDTD